MPFQGLNVISQIRNLKSKIVNRIVETAGVEPASESPVLQTSTYLVCCSLDFPEHSRQSSWKASLVKFRPGPPGKNQSYPIIDDAID